MFSHSCFRHFLMEMKSSGYGRNRRNCRGLLLPSFRYENNVNPTRKINTAKGEKNETNQRRPPFCFPSVAVHPAVKFKNSQQILLKSIRIPGNHSPSVVVNSFIGYVGGDRRNHRSCVRYTQVGILNRCMS